MTKELQCKIKPASIKKSCRWRVDTQVWNERGRSCFTVKCELWVLEAEVLKCSIELMRTNTHGLNLTILNNVRAYFITRTQPMSKCLLTHSHIFFIRSCKLKHSLFSLLSQGLISALFCTRKMDILYDKYKISYRNVASKQTWAVLHPEIFQYCLLKMNIANRSLKSIWLVTNFIEQKVLLAFLYIIVTALLYEERSNKNQLFRPSCMHSQLLI